MPDHVWGNMNTGRRTVLQIRRPQAYWTIFFICSKCICRQLIHKYFPPIKLTDFSKNVYIQNIRKSGVTSVNRSVIKLLIIVELFIILTLEKENLVPITSNMRIDFTEIKMEPYKLSNLLEFNTVDLIFFI